MLKGLETSVNKQSLRELIDENLGTICKAISKGDVGSTNKITDNLWCFGSFAGGTGVSTIVSEVAKLLSVKGLNVLIIDLNVNYPVQWLTTKLEYSRKSKDLYDLVLGTADLRDTILNGNRISLLGCKDRLIGELNNLETVVVGSNFDKILDSLKLLYDVVLVDCPFGSFSSMLVNTALYKCDKCYMVWSDSYSNINNYNKVIDLLKLFGISVGKMRYIYNKRGSMYINEGIFKDLGIANFISILPYDKSVVECSLEGKYYVEDGSGSSANASYFYKGLQELVNVILIDVGYSLDSGNLSAIKGFLGIEVNKKKSKLGKRLGKMKRSKNDDGLTDKVIDDITGVNGDDSLEDGENLQGSEGNIDG